MPKKIKEKIKVRIYLEYQKLSWKNEIKRVGKVSMKQTRNLNNAHVESYRIRWFFYFKIMFSYTNFKVIYEVQMLLWAYFFFKKEKAKMKNIYYKMSIESLK